MAGAHPVGPAAEKSFRARKNVEKATNKFGFSGIEVNLAENKAEALKLAFGDAEAKVTERSGGVMPGSRGACAQQV